MIDIGSAIINLNGFPQNEAEDILRCLRTLYSVRKGEQPLDRDFGIDYSFQDQPMNIAKNMFVLEVFEKTEKYEPRVSVEKVTYEFDINGQMIPAITCERGESI